MAHLRPSLALISVIYMLNCSGKVQGSMHPANFLIRQAGGGGRIMVAGWPLVTCIEVIIGMHFFHFWTISQESFVRLPSNFTHNTARGLDVHFGVTVL